MTNVDVTFSESIALTTLTFADLILSRDGSVNLINAGSGVVITQDLGDPTIYHVAAPRGGDFHQRRLLLEGGGRRHRRCCRECVFGQPRCDMDDEPRLRPQRRELRRF
ncbi:MAG: hypothetical protein U0744_06020 [Gemmataceae bacterium]